MNNETQAKGLVEVSPTRREFKLVIPDSEVQAEYEKILKSYTGRVKIAGFRKGHAPRDMVRKMFDSEIRNDVYESLVPRVLSEELKALRVNPVNVPVIRELSHEDGQALKCTVAFEVMPDFELPDYKKIKVKQEKVTVEEEEVERTLEEMRERAAEYVPVEGRGAGDGDYVAGEIQGKDLGTKKRLPAEKIVVLAGHAENDPALNENVSGVRAGEEKTFKVSYGKDHPAKRLAGKDIEYNLKISDIKEKKVPALNDDFAKSLGDYQNLADLKEKIRSRLSVSKEKSLQSSKASEVLKEIAKRVSLELPESVVEHEAQAVLRRLLSAPHQPQPTPEVVEKLKSQARTQAEENLSHHLILRKIAAKEGFEVTEPEILDEIKTIAQANNVPVATLTEMINRENRRDEIRETLLFRKTVDFLVKNAIMS